MTRHVLMAKEKKKGDKKKKKKIKEKHKQNTLKNYQNENFW